MKNIEYTTMTFLGKPIRMSKIDRMNPILLMYMVTIEMSEIRHGDGLVVLRLLREQYKIEIDPELERQIENCLISNKTTHNEYLEKYKGEKS